MAVALAVAGAVAVGAFAGPAMAADDGASPAGDMRKSGGEPPEIASMRKSGGEPPEFVVIRKAGGDGNPYIIAVL